MPSSDETTSKAQPTPPFSAGTIKRIHVNQHVIRRNTKAGDTAPSLSVKTSKGSFACSDVVIHGDSVVRYSPEWQRLHRQLHARQSVQASVDSLSEATDAIAFWAYRRRLGVAGAFSISCSRA